MTDQKAAPRRAATGLRSAGRSLEATKIGRGPEQAEPDGWLDDVPRADHGTAEDHDAGLEPMDERGQGRPKSGEGVRQDRLCQVVAVPRAFGDDVHVGSHLGGRHAADVA